MVRHHAERPLVLLRRTIRSLKICELSLHELEQVVAARVEGASVAVGSGRSGNLLGTQLEDPAALYHTPLVDTAAMTVTWAGRERRDRALSPRRVDRWSFG